MARSVLLVVWAAIGVPVVFVTYVHWTYSYALPKGELPYSIFPEWLWLGVFAACLGSGVASVAAVKLPRDWARISASIAYAIMMCAILFYLGLHAACANGDCL